MNIFLIIKANQNLYNNMNKITVITTFSDKNYQEYAKKCTDTWKKFLPSTVKLVFYVDNDSISYNSDQVLNLEKIVPELTLFKNRHADYQPPSFHYDAVRFSHKSYAICHSGLSNQNQKLFWLDADVMIKEKISEDWLLSFLPNNSFSSYLGRDTYTETGFLSFDLSNPNKNWFFQRWKNHYDNDEMFAELSLPKTDCHVYDAVRLEGTEKGIKFHDISTVRAKSPFNTYLKPYMVHYKGRDKFTKI